MSLTARKGVDAIRDTYEGTRKLALPNPRADAVRLSTLGRLVTVYLNWRSCFQESNLRRSRK